MCSVLDSRNYAHLIDLYENFNRHHGSSQLPSDEFNSSSEFWDFIDLMLTANLGFLNLKEVPKFVYLLTNIEKLDLSFNEIHSLTSDSQNWYCVTYLDLSHNKFSSFPREIFCLSTLEFISLSSNALCKLPTGWENLGRLKEVDLSCNNIQDFLPLLLLESIEVLKLNQNKIRYIPQAIANLRRLAHFDVRANRISELPCCLTTLKELEFLGISNNPLTFPPLSIASRGLPHILAFLSVRGEDTWPESPDSPCSGLAVPPKISVVVPRYSGSEEEEEEEERLPPEQEMKEVPETKASASPSVRPRHPDSNWWRVSAPPTAFNGRSPRKAVDRSFSRDPTTSASSPRTEARSPPKPARRSRHLSDSVTASTSQISAEDDSGDEDTKWTQYVDSHFLQSGPTKTFFMGGDDEFTPPDFPDDQDDMPWAKSPQSDTYSTSISQTRQNDSEFSVTTSSPGTPPSITRIRTPQWTKTGECTVVRRPETLDAAPSNGASRGPIPLPHSYPTPPLPCTSPQKPYPLQRSITSRPPSTPRTSYSPSAPSTTSSSCDSDTYPTVVRRLRKVPVHPRRQRLQLGDDQERNQALPIPANQPRVTRPVMYLPAEDSESDDSDDSESDLVSPPLYRPYPPKSRPHTQSRQEAEILSKSTVYRPPTVNRRNGYGPSPTHLAAVQRSQETAERSGPSRQSSQRRLTPQPSLQQPYPPQKPHPGGSTPQRHPISGTGVEAPGDMHRGQSGPCQLYPQMVDYAALWRSTAAQLKLLLESRLPAGLPSDPTALASVLHTGVYLANFLNSLLGYPAIKHIHHIHPSLGKAPFRARQNLTACRDLIRHLGVPKHRLFSVSRVLGSDSTVGLLGLLHCLQTLFECLARFDSPLMLHHHSGRKLAEPNSPEVFLSATSADTPVLPFRGRRPTGSRQPSSPPTTSASSRTFQTKFLARGGMYSDV